MPNVNIKGVDVQVKPKRLLDYIEKVDFIKSRRRNVFQLLSGRPETGKLTQEQFDRLFRIGCEVVYAMSSSVTIEEELAFDRSEEGFFYDMWRCLGATEGELVINGIRRAEQLWKSMTDTERRQIVDAINQVDERRHIKNSDGPDSKSPGPEVP